MLVSLCTLPNHFYKQWKNRYTEGSVFHSAAPGVYPIYYTYTRLEYKYTEGSVFHPAAPGLHPTYDYETFLGGALLLPRKIFQV